MKIHHLRADEAFESLRSSRDGLDPDEARRRLAEFGPNAIAERRRSPLLRRFLQGFTHFFAIILWIAACLAFFAEMRSPGEGMATLGWAILGVIVINGVFSFWQEYRAERAISALRKLLPHKAEVIRGGRVERVDTAELAPGDLVLLEGGNEVPADCRVVEAFSLRVSNATITGESAPLERDALPSDDEGMTHSRNVVLAGTSVLAGEAKALVYATGARTEFGRIAEHAQAEDGRLSPLQQEVVRLSRTIAVLATAIGLVFFAVGQLIGLSFWHNLLFAIGIIVANVPEGLLPTVTLALALGSRRMAQKNALIRHLPAVETLGSATVICSDKTGTLTVDRMTAEVVVLPGRAEPIPRAEVAAAGAAGRRLFEAALLCQDLKIGRGDALLGDPMEIALVELARSAGVAASPPRVDEIPFAPERKRLSTIHEGGDALLVYTKGALEAVLPRCARVMIDGEEQPLTPELVAAIEQQEASLANGGLRVLAFAHRRASRGTARDHFEEAMTFSGLVGLDDPPRPEVHEAVRRCHAAGIRVIMMTGDHPRTAVAVARAIALVRSPSPAVVTGERLRRMTDAELQLALDHREIVFARLDPEHKLRIVAALQQKGEIVAMTGDGVNDAPALRRADIGIAMGLSGTDVAREASDIILADDNFASIVAAIEEGRAVFTNIRRFLTYILTSNVPELVPYLAFVLFRIPLPLTILQILAVDLGTDMVPALGLGAEEPDATLMQRPPRRRSERLLDRGVLLRSYAFLGVLESCAAMAAFFFVLGGADWQYGELLGERDPLYLRATTACLGAIVLMQVMNVFLCRTESAPTFSRRPLSNRIILAGIAVELALLAFIVYTPWGNRIFGAAPLPPSVWLFILPFMAAMLLLEELRKGLARRASARTGRRGARRRSVPLLSRAARVLSR